jgi:PQQ-like domain
MEVLMAGSRARPVLVVLFGAVPLLVGIHPAAAAAGPGTAVLPAHAAAAGPVTQLWAQRSGRGNGFDNATSLGVSPDGSRVYVTGASLGATSADDYVTIAYDASSGSRLWQARYNGPANDGDDANALGVSPDGSRVFVTGTSFGTTTSSDYATVAYDASTGAELWVRRYNGPGNGPDGANAIGVSPDGSRVFVTGASAGKERPQGGPPYDDATVAYDASTGTRLWVARYDGPASGQDWGNALGLSPDGAAVFVTGLSQGSTSSDDYATLAYRASDGVRLWAKRFNGRANGPDDAFGLGVSPNGSAVLVTGTSLGSTSLLDYATVAYDASTGHQLWVARYGGSGHDVDRGLRVRVSPDGSAVFVTGYSKGSTTSYDYATVAYRAANGRELWERRYDGPGNADDFATGLALSPDGSTVFVTGGSFSSTGWNSSDYATVAYDGATGRQVWVKRYSGRGNHYDSPSAVVASPVGTTVFVTGQSDTGSLSDYATVAYGGS